MEEVTWSLTIIDIEKVKGDSPEDGVTTDTYSTCERAVADALERMDDDQRFEKGEMREIRELLDGGGCVQHGNKIYKVEEQETDRCEASDAYFEDDDEEDTEE